ncbi:MAG: ABC transporter ATP-binding protein [Pseudolysinimonas sp.]
MTTVVEAHGLTKHFGKVHAVEDATFTIEENRIYGLLGRNGAGKTTLMSLLTGQEFATSGRVEVYGHSPVENAGVLERTAFIKESQRYPDDFRVKHVLKSAPWFFANWDAGFADQLVEEFRLPRDRRIKKLSRGQLSAVGVIVGLASRAPLTFFDEPYLGLDAVARQLFYDRLLADYAEHPRTVVLSTHLIDEVSNLLEHVIVIDDGRIIIDSDADELRGSATTVAGTSASVDAFTKDREVLHREGIGGLASATLAGLDASGRRAAAAAGLELTPVSLQQLIVRSTTSGIEEK